MTGRVLRFPHSGLSLEARKRVAQEILATPTRDRPPKALDLGLEDPDVLLALCAELREQMPSVPARVLEEAEFFYRFLDYPRRAVGLLDERDYFLGEMALIAGMASRLLAHRDDARKWFDRAEASYRLTVNPVAELSRLAYQRLALDLEERRFEYVLELIPRLEESFSRLGMAEDALKCQCLEGLTLMEMGELDSAVEAFQRIRDRARELGSQQILASSYVNMIHLHAMLGNEAAALEASSEAVPILQKSANRIDFAKVQWGIGTLLRNVGQVGPAIDAYRASQREFAEMKMMADVAAAHLVIADLLLNAGEESRAVPEILAALPIIDELKMVPEGVAALTLLRESLRQKKINRQALRDLHGYFEEIQK